MRALKRTLIGNKEGAGPGRGGPGRNFGRNIDGKPIEKQVKNMPNTSLKLPPKNRKLL
jgi:hypothetical protein